MLLLMLFMLLCDRSWARCKCDWFRLCRPCVFRKSFFSLLETFNKCILIWISSERWWCARMLLYNVQCTLRSPQNNCACVCERVGAGRPIRGCVWVYYTLNAASSGRPREFVWNDVVGMLTSAIHRFSDTPVVYYFVIRRWLFTALAGIFEQRLVFYFWIMCGAGYEQHTGKRKDSVISIWMP